MKKNIIKRDTNYMLIRKDEDLYDVYKINSRWIGRNRRDGKRWAFFAETLREAEIVTIYKQERVDYPAACLEDEENYIGYRFRKYVG